MSAGSGIVHSEINRSNAPCRLLQIWIEPEQRGLAPAYEQKPITIANDWTALIHPDAVGEAMTIASSTQLWRAQPEPGQNLPLPHEPELRIWIQVINGELELRGDGDSMQVLKCGDGVGIANPQLTQRHLTGLNRSADVLMFACPETPQVE